MLKASILVNHFDVWCTYSRSLSFSMFKLVESFVQPLLVWYLLSFLDFLERKLSLSTA